MEFGKQKQKKNEFGYGNGKREGVGGRLKESTNEMKLSKDIWCPIENNIHAHKPQHINTLTQLRKAKTHSNTHTLIDIYSHTLTYSKKEKKLFATTTTMKSEDEPESARNVC